MRFAPLRGFIQKGAIRGAEVDSELSFLFCSVQPKEDSKALLGH